MLYKHIYIYIYRSRSHHHNRHVILNNNNSGSPGLASGPGKIQHAQIPFDIFLLNLKNVQCSSSSSSRSCTLANDSNNQFFFLDAQFGDPETAEKVPKLGHYDLECKEKKILNGLNIQMFMEHMCAHKRHIKLENLKSLNMSHNKVKLIFF